MDYEEQVRAMVKHATIEQPDFKSNLRELGKLIRALGRGIALVALGLPKESQPIFVREVSTAIMIEICNFKRETLTTEDFLRNHYHPEKFNG